MITSSTFFCHKSATIGVAKTRSKLEHIQLIERTDPSQHPHALGRNLLGNPAHDGRLPLMFLLFSSTKSMKYNKLYFECSSQWCTPLNLQPKQSGGQGSIPGRVPPFKGHDKRSRTRLGLLYFCDPNAWR